MINLTEKQIDEIDGDLDCGLNCYIHKETNEIISIPNEFHLGEIDDDSPFNEDLQKIEENEDNYIRIEPMDSRESFGIMEDFCNTVENLSMKEKLLTALERPKPFANFKFDLESDMETREKWFEYKHKRYIEYVTEILKFAFDDEEEFDI